MTITIVLPISRSDYLKRIFARLDMMPCSREDVHLFTYVDGDQRLFEVARNLTVASKFSQKLCVYRSKGMANVGSVRRRRERISAIHNEIKQYINASDYMLLLEDDTLTPFDTIGRMISSALDYPHAGLISGTEIGRWGWEHIGAWRVNDVYNISHIESIPKETGIREVDATGLYTCLIRSDLYMKHRFEPFDIILGPDFNLGIELRKSGYKNYIDFDIQCAHMTQKTDITVSKSNIVQVAFDKIGTKWSQGLKERV